MSALPAIDRAAINRANSEHSTGPRTAEGKARSSQNALRHGLLSRTPVLPSEDQAAYQQYYRQFFDEYRPATPTETQLTQELADTAWRLNRIPALEANLLNRAAQAMELDIAEAHRTLSMLGLHRTRLSRQFQKTLQQLREIQADRITRRERDLKDAA
jgi:C4-dicarboxylate-specific signal transduction histidine kinase